MRCGFIQQGVRYVWRDEGQVVGLLFDGVAVCVCRRYEDEEMDKM